MKKIVINLSPQKTKTSNLGLENIIVYTPIVAISAIVGLGLVLLLHLAVLKQAHSHSSKLKVWKKWESKAKTLGETKQKIAESRTRLDQLAAVLTPKYEMSSVLGDIFSVLPKNIWFKELDFYEKALVIKGYVVKWNQDYLASLDGFIKALRERGYFSSKFNSLSIKGSQKVNFNGLEVLKFTIECKK